MEEFQTNILSSLKDIGDQLSALNVRVHQLESEFLQKNQNQGNKLSGEDQRTREGSELGATSQSESFFTGKSAVRETLGERTSAYQLADGEFSGNGIAVCVQDEFTAIKDKVSSVKIPPELRVGNSKVGIRREDQLTANIIGNSARYVETTLKLLWNLNNGASKDDLIDIFMFRKPILITFGRSIPVWW